MSCPYCHKDVKHRKPCKVFVKMQNRERAEAEKKKVEDEKKRLVLIDTTTDVEILRNEIERLRLENKETKRENEELKQEIDRLENRYEEPYQYRCCKCGDQTGYDGYCGRCSPDESF